MLVKCLMKHRLNSDVDSWNVNELLLKILQVCGASSFARESPA